MVDITLSTTGTIAFTNGSPDLVGTDTLFAGLLAGDLLFAPDGQWYEIADDAIDNVNLSLTKNYGGVTNAAAAGGSDWWILRTSKARDSVRTATRQLTDVTSLYRRILNLTAADQTVRLNKSAAADRAGLILQNGGLDLFQAGTFEDDDFSLKYLVATTWTKALGVSSATGATSLYSQLLFGGVITPAQIHETTSNYAPDGIERANIIRMSTDSDWALTGLTGGVAGRVIVIMNVGAQTLMLENEGGISSPANRFALVDDTAVPAGSAALLIYDGVASRWRLLSGPGGGASGGVDPNKGWSPILAYVAYETGFAAQIVDWVGGEGTKPSVGSYIGAEGLVSEIEDAVNVRGPAGAQIQFRLDNIRNYVQWSYVDTIEWVDLIPYSAITGPTASPEWVFSTGVADEDPGAGKISFNNATFASITYLYINKTSFREAVMSDWINTWDDSSSLPNRGILSLQKTSDNSKFAIFLITDDIVSSGDYFKIPVSPQAGAILTADDQVSLTFIRTGDKGIPGVIPRGDYDAEHSYLVGDVVDVDGSSYISLVQPNLGNTVTPEGTNANWALFARGVNQAFVDAINQTLADATTQAANSAASAVLAQNYAVQVVGYASGTDFSAKEHAVGDQAGTGGSAKNWASQIGADVTGAATNSRSAKSWAQESLVGVTLGGSAKDWAVETTASVDGTLFSAKEYAQGNLNATGGSAKNWAQQTGADVTGASINNRSAKSWAQESLVGATLGGSAKDWASHEGSTVDGTSYSAKHYALSVVAKYDDILILEELIAEEAAESAANAISAASSAATAEAQADIATAKAIEATNALATATTKATEAGVARDAAVVAKNDAQAAETSTSADVATVAGYRDEAEAFASAAAGYATALANPDYGFFTDAPADNRDYGSFV